MEEKSAPPKWFSLELGEKLRESEMSVALEGEEIVIRISIPPSVSKSALASMFKDPVMEKWEDGK